MVRRTKEDALATRHRILDAAELLFQRCGVSRTSLHDIAQAAEVTRGAIYWHFKDKADLFNAMMERASMPMEESLGKCGACPVGDDPLAFIERRLVEALRLTATHPQTRRVFEIATHKVEYVDELLAVRDRHLAGRNECLAEVERELKSAMRRGLIGTKVPARSIGLGLHALVDGLIQNWMLDPEAFDLVRVGKQVLATYLAGIRTTAPADASVKRSARSTKPLRAETTGAPIAP
ncbi:TetR family transcriptional regulator [Ideonella sp. BN130291]|uniref:TetR family transcriptional regulator n=1 Tax=Ideonella sp. BN130291 TaxID=3112940 RepID=UPI002E255DE9|nr:TetR family transcriptional regulator [Ideonella sp. BN130291]